MNVITQEGSVPIFSWCDNLEEEALNQMKVIAKLPFVKKCAIMPDGHLGMENGAPIGSVIATEDVIVPNFIGVDVSCGMSAFKTNLNVSDFTEEKKQTVHHAIERTIPTGFSHNSEERMDKIDGVYGKKIDEILNECKSETKIASRKDILSQIGTLGGGNHFLEIQHDENGSIYGMIHSGSRNIGKKVCDHFDEVAMVLNKKWYSNNSCIPFLPVDTMEGRKGLYTMDEFMC